MPLQWVKKLHFTAVKIYWIGALSANFQANTATTVASGNAQSSSLHLLPEGIRKDILLVSMAVVRQTADQERNIS